MWYKAREIVNKPYIVWDLVAKTVEDYLKDWDEDPLVMPEELIPDNVYGICPLKIVSGELIDRTEGEMDTASDEYTIMQKISTYKNKVSTINTDSFAYDSVNFPMNATSRLFYQALDKIPGVEDVNCFTLTGATYTLANANITAFLTAYYTKLKTLAQADDES